MMSRNSTTTMNDVLSPASPNAANFAAHGSPNTSEPIVRSISDASEFASVRRTGLSNLDYRQMMGRFAAVTTSPRTMPENASSPSASQRHHTPAMFAGQNSQSPQQQHSRSQLEDEDYDLNMVFEEIGAMQKTGLDESEDDLVVGSLPTVTSQRNSVMQQQQQLHQSPHQQHQHSQPLSHVQSPMSQQKRQQQQQNHSASPHGPNRSHHPQTALAHTSDGKIITYNPELYDEADMVLTNEKYQQNINYLKEFRCEQCPLFQQHKCTQHKPFTCFNWHFANQRRRRPLRKRDGTFNYSPDQYCNKYDETTGICPDGDECPHLHRTAGDTERRYHLRYYKTGMCVYDTNAQGFCVKNGPHCAFAHGQHDLRMPVYDVREQAQSDGETDGLINGHGLYDKDRNAVNEDPRWQEIAFVLANYKTEICKRPPRLCRQGYACPQYHNSKDRRRSPKKFKYRSTPCPSVKQGDEWGDPANCENDDNCTYCHTRTEQQFHPEIYKSTKCNDIQQSNYCPRGPFCAFAHSESSDEINAARDFSTDPSSDIPPVHAGKNNGVVANANTSPVDIARANSLSTYNRSSAGMPPIPSSLPDHFDFNVNNFDLTAPQPPLAMNQHEHHGNNGGASNLGPIARPRSFSTSNTKAVQPLPLSALLEKNNLLKQANAGSMGSTIFSAASSTSSLFGTVPEHPQQQPSSFSSAMMPAFYGIPPENVSIDSVLTQMEDLNFDRQSLANANASSTGTAGGMDNHQIGVDIANNSLGSIGLLRRSSNAGNLLNDSSTAPINIPANARMGPSISEVRSTSATGYNMSPPMGPLESASPLGSSFALASSFTSRQASCPAGQQPSSSQVYDSLLSASMSQSHNGPVSIATVNRELVGTLAIKEIENQRLTTQVHNLQLMLQKQIAESRNSEKLLAKARDEAIDMLNSTQKELELVRTTGNAFQRQLSGDLNSMSLNQLLQLEKSCMQNLSCVQEVLVFKSC